MRVLQLKNLYYYKMEKSKIDTRIIEIAIDRLARENKQKAGLVPEWYLFGYTEAICDLLWDYTGLPLSQLQTDLYDAWVSRMQEAIEKIENSPVKKTKIKEIKKNEETHY